jgi:type VI secretion system protein ImpG
MEKLLPYFERELGVLRASCREFSRRYPQLAGKLLMSGEASADPHIEHLIQSTAFLNARIGKRLDDDYAELTEALLGMLYGHYLRPIPACSIARFDCDDAKAINAVTTLPRGTELKSVSAATPTCKFKTAYDVAIAPVALAKARFEPLILAPAGLALPAGASAHIAIDIDTAPAAPGLDQLQLPFLRVFIDGDPSFRATLRDTLFMRVARAYVELDGDGRWLALDEIPLAAVGFAERDALIPAKPTEHPAYRLLTEYFAFPEKFNFFDIDLAAPLHHRNLERPCRRLTLHLALTDLRANSDAARILKPLSNKHLLLACTPVVNLFRQQAVPVKLTHLAGAYPLRADVPSADSCDIYSVDSVQLLRRTTEGAALTEFTPYYSMRHGDGPERKGHHWLLRRDEDMASLSPGHEFGIAFVDRDFMPVDAESGTMSIELTCTNRDLPNKLPYGLPGGDLNTETGASACPIRLLRQPSASRRLSAGRGAHWGLIAHLSLNHRSLTADGREAFAAMLGLYALPDDAIAQRQIDGLADLGHRSAMARLRDRRGPAFVSGVEVRVTLDEEAFVGSGVHAFAQVLDHFFGLYVHLNSFTQLTVLSKQSGKELLRCPPRNGALNLA